MPPLGRHRFVRSESGLTGDQPHRRSGYLPSSRMGNFTFSEIFTIVVVILIVFGPNRLPELARKAGTLAARARAAMDSLKSELDAEYGEALAPLREARDELRSAGAEFKGQMAAIEKDVAAAGSELKGAAEEAIKPVSEASEPATATEDAPAEDTQTNSEGPGDPEVDPTIEEPDDG